ncbi:hypothetical protein J31TS4_27030 [Paenibacillus sp. J31TS4]|uniref:hypothetical protein n=1 Tax=Paenibacillus sp. J31TS4 TaxID=2807195 RepID=UPI001B23A4B1|nr:hypothetical protein [Paenibacillus sp. J31TS4]GIP39423.1 hypothetical protein J31TS4_27030 [Paenibacillus sp. J31TS4]
MNMTTILGAVLILLGAALFLNRGETVDVGTIFAYFWPSLFVLPLSMFFHWMHFAMLDRKAPGLLVPGGILFISGLVCQLAMLTDGWAYLWPGFLLAVAVGLLELYWFGYRHKALLIPVVILTVLALVFFAAFSIGTLFNRFAVGQPLIAIGLILVGVWAMVGKKQRV